MPEIAQVVVLIDNPAGKAGDAVQPVTLAPETVGVIVVAIETKVKTEDGAKDTVIDVVGVGDDAEPSDLEQSLRDIAVKSATAAR